VKFTSHAQNKIASPAEIRFFLLHLSLFREYLDLEFSLLKNQLNFGYDLERIIDDWIVICYLVGNDFLPHLPALHISGGALPLMYSVYKRVLPTLDGEICNLKLITSTIILFLLGYLNEAGTIAMDRFILFLDELGRDDFEDFANMNPDVDIPVENYARKQASDLASLMANTDFVSFVF